MESIREIRVNLPLVKEIRKTDEYATHMKNLVVNKPRTLEEGDVKLNARCSTILQNQLSPKEKDPRSFILPCFIGNLTVRNALANLGANVSIMPLSMFKQLGLRKLKSVNMTMEITDRTKSILKGIMENLLVKIDKFIFPVDFVILDMVEDFRMPIILRRPFLATAHADIDVFRKLISLEVEEPRRNRRCDIDHLSVVKPKVHWCEGILQLKGDEHDFWASCDPYDDQCDGGDVSNNTE
ncbi:serine--tRNA ligase-like protein [Tanacetum coccineum]